MTRSGRIAVGGMVLLSALFFRSSATAQDEERARWFRVPSWTGTIEVSQKHEESGARSVTENRRYSVRITFTNPEPHPDGTQMCWTEPKGAIVAKAETEAKIIQEGSGILLFRRSCEGSGTVPVRNGHLCIRISDELDLREYDLWFQGPAGEENYKMTCEEWWATGQTSTETVNGHAAGARVHEEPLPVSGLALKGRRVDEGITGGERTEITWSLKPEPAP